MKNPNPKTDWKPGDRFRTLNNGHEANKWVFEVESVSDGRLTPKKIPGAGYLSTFDYDEVKPTDDPRSLPRWRPGDVVRVRATKEQWGDAHFDSWELANGRTFVVKNVFCPPFNATVSYGLKHVNRVVEEAWLEPSLDVPWDPAKGDFPHGISASYADACRERDEWKKKAVNYESLLREKNDLSARVQKELEKKIMNSYAPIPSVVRSVADVYPPGSRVRVVVTGCSLPVGYLAQVVKPEPYMGLTVHSDQVVIRDLTGRPTIMHVSNLMPESEPWTAPPSTTPVRELPTVLRAPRVSTLRPRVVKAVKTGAELTFLLGRAAVIVLVIAACGSVVREKLLALTSVQKPGPSTQAPTGKRWL